MSNVNVFGAGAFGTALAVSLAQAENHVRLIARTTKNSAQLESDRENKIRLPGIGFPRTLTVGTEPAPDANANLVAVPMAALLAILIEHRNFLTGQVIVACNKGVDLKTGFGPTGIILAEIPDATAAIISGPSFAVDIGAGLPTALTLASSTELTSRQLQETLSFSNIRLYRSDDITGVELGGALKNVIAIAAGIAVGAGLGESARAAIMTRGFFELTQFASAMGARRETLFGLSGFGDLVLTCTSRKSRNYCHGLVLGQGQTPDDQITVEGVKTAGAVHRIATSKGIEMPITSAINSLLSNETTISESISALMARPLRKE